jgi:hypothetical protein
MSRQSHCFHSLLFVRLTTGRVRPLRYAVGGIEIWVFVPSQECLHRDDFYGHILKVLVRMLQMGTMARKSSQPIDSPGAEGFFHEGAAKSRWISRFARSQSIVLIFVAIQLSGLLTYDYFWRVERPFMDNRIALHRAILDGSAPYEYRYRILMPKVADILARVLQYSPISSSHPNMAPLSYSRNAFELAYICLDLLGFFVLLWSLGELVRRLFQYSLALFGMALASFLINFAFRDHYFHPWSFLEGALFALGLLLIHQERYWLFSGISILGVFNRETSVFLLLAFFFYTLPQAVTKRSLADLHTKRAFKFAIASLILWGLGFLVLHKTVGYKPPTFLIETAWKDNRDRWPYTLTLNCLLFGPMWFWVVRGVLMSPLLIRRAAMIIPLYLGLLLVIGYWWEIRYWISVIPILIPGLIAAISKPYLRAVPVTS